MMSAPAVKPALPNAGAQAPKVGSGAPPGTTNNPPSSAAGGPKVLPTSGSPNRPIAPANANHAALGTMPLSLVQEHRASSALNQQPTPQPPQTSALSRTPEKPKEIQAASTLGPKPTSNGVEGSPNRPASAIQPPLETKKPEEASAAAIVNHSTDNAPVAAAATAAAVIPASQPAQHNTPANVPHLSPVKSLQPQAPAVLATTGPTATNHLASSVAPSKPEAGKPDGSGVVATSLAGSTAAQAAEPPPPTVAIAASGTSSTSPPVQPVQTTQPAPPPLPPPQQQPQQPPPPPPPPSPPSTPTPPPPPPPQQQQQQHQAPQLPSQSQQQQNQPPQKPQEAQSAQQHQKPPQPQPPQPQPPQPQPPQPQPPQQPAQQQPPLPAPPPPPPQQQQQQQQASPTQESPAKTPVTTPETKTKVDSPSKPEFKVATPPRNSKRKREVKTPAETPKSGASDQDDRKSKRVRTRTQPYQSPLPELTYIAKLKNLMKNPDDKLIVFYKNEFLAVRNAEGSFYICQAMQNIYKSSPRIRIRWLSQEKKDNKPTDVYIPDFYDATDFDCILTNLELKKLDKNKYQLPEEERERTQSILKRALDVEKGVSEKPPVTEEHPDGLDLSLFRDESQLKKRKSLKPTPTKKGKENTSEVEDGWGSGEEGEGESEEEPKKKKPKTPKKVEKPKVSTKEKVKTKEKSVDNKRAERTSERGRERAPSSRRRSEPTTASTATAAAAPTTPTPAAAKNAAVKQPAAKQTSARQAAAKPAATKSPAEKKAKVASKTPKKTEPAVDISIPTRSTKTRSVKAASQPKTSPVTRTKERDRRGETPAKGRKKPGKKA